MRPRAAIAEARRQAHDIRGPAALDDDYFFTPGASPPATLFADPVFSPRDHAIRDEGPLHETLHMSVDTKTLGLDLGLVGDTDGIEGIVTSRFYHHITGSPMFLVDFGGGIGERSVCVSDTKLIVERPFGDTTRVLFGNTHSTSEDGGDHLGPLLWKSLTMILIG